MISLRQQVYDTLLKRILSGVIVPGEEVNRRTLAAEMGMSVAPVLEALQILQTQGLIETLPRKGTRVRIQREADALGNYLVREALECQLARHVYGHTIADHYPTLLPLAKAIDTYKDGRRNTLWEAEVDFHCAVADLLDSAAFSTVFRTAICVDMFYKLRYESPRPDLEKRSSHVLLLNRLRDAATPETAAGIVRDDLRAGRAAHFLKRIKAKNGCGVANRESEGR